MASGVPTSSIPLSIPNSSAPIADVEGDITLSVQGNVAQGSVALSAVVTKAWWYIFGTFLVRTATGQGWQVPTGTGSRATFNASATFPVSNPPTQAEVVAIAAQVVVLQTRLAQLIEDQLTSGTISK